MPKIGPLVLPVADKTFAITGNADGTATWITPSDTFDGGEKVAVTRRTVSNGQETRKSVIRLSVPLFTDCELTCDPIARGNILLSLDVIFPNKSSVAERTAALEEFSELLSLADVKSAIVNNELFYS